jgi:aspartate 4-decarboxylase
MERTTSTGGGTSCETERELQGLSPFELKNRLIALADDEIKRAAVTMLNAGRGNPDWIATTPREAFFLLGRFGIEEARRDWDEWDDLGGMPARDGIGARLDAFLEAHRAEPGADLLARTLAYGTGELGFARDAFAHELTDAVIGDNYPVPDRMLPHIEKLVHEYLVQELCGGEAPAGGDFDLFATEGGTAAMCYLFDSAVTNRLLERGDRVAIMAPIFTPYLEIPHLDRYAFDVVTIRAQTVDQDGVHTWQYDRDEVEQLADPSVRALFVVNPSNPPSVALAPETLDQIAAIVAERNPNLAIITDDVYGTFVNGFRSLMSVAPRNTLGVYSFSKYFGATGWRLGVIAVHPDNVFDEQIAALGDDDRRALHERYATITLEPEKLKFVDRLVADSRQVALNHTAGLSLPQQLQMGLFAAFALLDTTSAYKQSTQAIIARRLHALVKGMGIPLPRDPLAAHYYVELDLLSWAERHWGAEFAAWMRDNYEPVDPVFRLAERHAVVLLNGGGFDAPEWSVRVSLANLRMDAYENIGKWLWDIGQSYKEEFDRSRA